MPYSPEMRLFLNLTNNRDVRYHPFDAILTLLEDDKSMKGVVRARGKCPSCKQDFQYISKKLGYICKSCKITPSRFYVDLFYQGKRLRLFSDKTGQVLDSYQRSLNLLSHINYELDAHTFDLSSYLKAELEKFYFSTLFKTWKDSKENCSPHYLRQIEYAESYIFLKREDRFLYFRPTTDVRDIRTSDIEKFYHSLKNISPKSRYNIVGILKSFVNYLYRLEYIKHKPVFPQITLPEPSWKWLSEEQQALIFSHIPEKDKPIFIFMALHGSRPGEARGLKVLDINFNQQSITIQRAFSLNILRNTTKNKRIRVIPIHPDFIEILSQCSRDKLPEAFVFTNPRTGKSYADTTLREIWYVATKKAGIKITLYEGVRHSFASQRVSNSISLYLVSKCLGHSDLRVTQRYAQVSLEALRVAVENKSRAKIIPLQQSKTVTRPSQDDF